MEIYEFRAYPDDRQYGEAAVIAPLPFASTQANTASRMAETARLSGVDIYAFTRPGADLEHPDPALRRELTEGDFRAHNEQILKRLGGMASDYGEVLGWGDSTGAYSACALALDEAQPFDRLLLRDGINLRRLPPGLAHANYFGYQAWEAWKLRDDDNGMLAPEAEDVTELDVATKARRAVLEIYHFGPLWSGAVGRVMAEAVACQRPELPVFDVAVGHSFTGTPSQTRWFHEHLRILREFTSTMPAPFVADYRSGWYHRDLLRPQEAARDIRSTLALPLTVRSPLVDKD